MCFLHFKILVIRNVLKINNISQEKKLSKEVSDQPILAGLTKHKHIS